jgi:hypothetical protein
MRPRLEGFRSQIGSKLKRLWIAGAIACSSPAWAQDDGARLYMMVPDGTTIASMRFHFLNSDVSTDEATVSEGNNLHTTLVVFQFVQALRFGRDQSFIFLVVPASHISTNANPSGTPDSIDGLGDVQLGFVLGVHGTPALAPAEYAEHRPGLAVNLLGKIFFPTGSYSAHRSVNVGANRWALRLGVPIVYAIGKRMADPQLMTVELMPTITLFGTNHDPFGAKRSWQKPLFIFEGHVTRGFTRNFWASFDLLWRRGGELQVDGIDANNSQRALSLGVTGTFALSQSASFRLSYGRVVDRNAHGPNGSMVRAIIGFVF